MTTTMPQEQSAPSPTIAAAAAVRRSRHAPLWSWASILGASLVVLCQAGCAVQPTPARASLAVGSCTPTERSASQLTRLTRTDGEWVGASKTDVVRLRGRPDERRQDLWFYGAPGGAGAAEVLRFSGPRVVSVTAVPAAGDCALDG
jgi:hypothetical protein